MNSVTVVVPTYKRPKFLESCVISILQQSHLPDEIILVSRDDDFSTIEKIKLLKAKFAAKVLIRHEVVVEPGFLPPIEKGITAADKDIIVFIDDDAEAHSDWLERLLEHYKRSEVGGVGGRVVNYFNDQLAEYEPVEVVGKLYWYGKSIGDLYKDTLFCHPVNVDFFMGGNMSFRSELLRRVSLDKVIKENVAFHWEMDVAQQIKHQGFKLIFDPQAKVDHHTAPRELDGLRTINYEAVYWSNHNYSYLIFKHSKFIGKLVYPFYTFIIGSSLSMGVARIFASVFRNEKINWRDDLLASIRGRIHGIRRYYQEKS